VIVVRADACFGVPALYDICEHWRILYTFGLSSNAVLKRRSAALLAQAARGWEQEQQAARREDRPPQPQRLFTGFWYPAHSWPQPRWVIVKAEANAQGSNRRFIVTNRPGAALLAEVAYDAYAGRGESENRNKEFKCDLAMDRLSDHRFCANFFRLYLHAAALNLLVRLRRRVALPVSSRPPAETQTEAERRRHFRQRRQHDPLGEGQPWTWRSLFIQVAAEVVVSSRRVLVRLSSCWPHLQQFRQVCERLHMPASGVVPASG
jgi:hypothetical protein